jgi:hypothetical protein
MLYAIMKETYAWPTRSDALPLETIGPIAAKDSFERAMECAEGLAAKFGSHSFEGNSKYPYHWGRDKDAPYIYHFVIKATTSKR